MFLTILFFLSVFLFSQSSNNLYSPSILLPKIGDAETMHFGFFVRADMPDSDGDNDDYLDDYYRVAMRDMQDIAWHVSNSNSIDGSNFWCSDEKTGGYLNSWIQYLDTPSIILNDVGVEFSVQISYAIESPDGPFVDGSCADGWDSVNIRISNDGGVTWNLLEDSSYPYDFDCGYGWIWNDSQYDIGGNLNHLAKGWGGNSNGWFDFTADLSQYANEEIIIRFAFGSDPAWCTSDDESLIGLQIDNIKIKDSLGLILFSDLGNETSQMIATGAVWNDQFYDYGSEEDLRPGASEWTFYSPGMPFVPTGSETNVYLDISDFAEKTVQFRIQTLYDNDNVGGVGRGLFIDDFWIYKLFSGNYIAPSNLVAEAASGSVVLDWDDMNSSGTEDFIYDNDTFNNQSGVRYNGWVGKKFDILGKGFINEISIFNINDVDTLITFAIFEKSGALFKLDPLFPEQVINVSPGWNSITIDSWNVENSFILGHQVSDDFGAAYDNSSSFSRSYLRLGEGAWDIANQYELNGIVLSGEFGIRANITYEGLGVTYNVYRDDLDSALVAGLTSNTYIDSNVENNLSYEYSISSTYPNGEESEKSDPVLATPLSDTVHELYWDDGTSEGGSGCDFLEYATKEACLSNGGEWGFIAGSGNYSVVKYSTYGSINEKIERFKWYQNGSGGAFYIKIFNDDDGLPGAEIFSKIQASGNINGWNEKDLSGEALNVNGDFWIGVKEFSSSKPFGLDVSSSSGNSYKKDESGDWEIIEGNLMYRVYLDCGADCPINSNRVAENYNVIIENNNVITEPVFLIERKGKKICKIPFNINNSQLYRIKEKSSILYRSDALSDDLIPLFVFDFENEELSNLWLHDQGWNLSTLDYAPESPIHSFNSPDPNFLSNEYIEIPNKHGIISIFPNPFNPIVNIQFAVHKLTKVTLSIYDLNGRRIKTLIDQKMNPGYHSQVWDGNNLNGLPLSSGIYFAVIDYEDSFKWSQKMILFK